MKKYLKYLFLILFSFLTFNINVHAVEYTDYNVYYFLRYGTETPYDFDNELIDDTHSFKEFIDSLINYANNSQDYYLLISMPQLADTSKKFVINVTLIPKSLDSTILSSYNSYFGVYTGTQYQFKPIYFPSIYHYENDIVKYKTFESYPLGHNFYESSTYTFLVSCLTGGSCENANWITQNFTPYIRLPNSPGISQSSQSIINFTNTGSFFFDSYGSVGTGGFIYYSSMPIYFQKNTTGPYTSYYKSLTINGTTYDIGDRVPTYCEVYELCNTNTNTLIFNSNSLYTTYTNFSPSDISNYSLKLEFETSSDDYVGLSADEYVDNVSFLPLCSGRISHSGDYYTYHTFDCGISTNYTISDDTITYTFNNLTYSENISQYDKIYVSLKSNYVNTSLSSYVSNFRIRFDIGNVYNTDFKGYIYETFDNLPLNFDMYLSSNNSSGDSYVYIPKYDSFYNITFKALSNTSFDLSYTTGQSILGSFDIVNGTSTYLQDFDRFSITNNNGVGLAITQYGTTYNLPRMTMFFNQGLVITINSTKSQDFYYIQSDGTITNGQFHFDYVSSSTDDYDLTFYISKVNSFIDDLSESCNELSILTQDFYNGLPIFFQTFIFVIFILFCIYFTYLLIKKRGD